MAAVGVERARPVLLSYSRDVEHVGALGAGQLAKTCNNPPLTGQVDQLVKTMTAGDVAALLYEQECTYLGRRITPLASGEGGL